jgi:hypothetical protein
MRLQLLFASSVLIVSASVGSAETFSPQCAAEDIRLVIMIEEHGTTGAIPSDRLHAAYVATLQARSVCKDGQVAEAIRMYGDVSLTSEEASAKPK